jgi:peptide-N4-(N-acetyl-beta-glucosaminyl)asparagine amidase
MVIHYQNRFKEMSTQQNKNELINYAELVLRDSITGLNYSELIKWEHRHLSYTSGYLETPRPELPIPILERGKGRCGEFALLYIGSLLANNYTCRMVFDVTEPKNSSEIGKVGDHVWAEVLVNGSWIHVDPTAEVINKPQMYAEDWHKRIDLVYAFADKEIIDVTKTYGGQ